MERLRAQREEERARREREAEELAERQQSDSAARSNPLLAGALGGGGAAAPALKRRFGDDTVFSGTHASEPEQAKKARFINDTMRSDFSRRFMAKFIL